MYSCPIPQTLPQVLCIIAASRCHELAITRQEAMNIIISGGIVTPHRDALSQNKPLPTHIRMPS